MKGGETAVQQAERRAKARQRAMADRYHAVPALPSATPAGDERPAPSATDEPAVPAESGPTRPEAAGKGRVAPTAHGPVAPSRASGRNQPSRKPRSKRGQK